MPWPPKKGVAFTFDTGLISQANPTVCQSTPTLAAGDVKVWVDGGASANIATLPTATGKRVPVALSSSEMNGDRVFVVFSDVAGAEWFDRSITILTDLKGVGELPSSSQVRDSLTAVLSSDRYAELSTAPPSSSRTIVEMLSMPFELSRNSVVQTSSAQTLWGATSGAKFHADLTLSAGTSAFTRGAWTS